LLCNGCPAFTGSIGYKPELVFLVTDKVDGFPGAFDRLVSDIQNPVKIDEKSLYIHYFIPAKKLPGLLQNSYRTVVSPVLFSVAEIF
jgi:hypothetical protein